MPESHKRLRKMSDTELQLRLLFLYIDHHDERALRLLKSGWPQVDWDAAIADLRARAEGVKAQVALCE